MCVVKAESQARAEERNGRRRTEGRVKPRSWTSSGGGSEAFAACVRRSLFLRMRRRFLDNNKCQYLKIEDGAGCVLSNVIERMERNSFSDLLLSAKGCGGEVHVTVSR